MIGIVDYGMGNILSVKNAIENLGFPVELCSDPESLLQMERLILPGVGAFGDCVNTIRSRGFVSALNAYALELKRPVMGICLGMQIMAEKGYENGEHLGLGWIPGEVTRLEPGDSALRIPQIGWNEVLPREGSPFFKGIPPKTDFYFVHSYRMRCKSAEAVEATCLYGQEFTAAVRVGNIFATQFHPEKSQDFGLKLLDNFLKWTA